MSTCHCGEYQYLSIFIPPGQREEVVMAPAHNQRSDPKTPPADAAPVVKGQKGTGRRRLRTPILCIAGLGLLVVGWYGWRWYTAPAPPEIAFADVDPAVQEAIEKARREVWWHPHSAAAWGRWGQVLRALG